MPGSERVVLGALGDERVIGKLHLESHPMVESITPILAPYKMVSREWHAGNTIVEIDGVPLGGKKFVVIAGPCAVETRAQMFDTAKQVIAAGAVAIRGGAYKPRTSPYSFQGLGLDGLHILRDLAKELKIPTVTEVVEVADVAAVEAHASAFQ